MRRRFLPKSRRVGLATAACAIVLWPMLGAAREVRFLDQGRQWTDAARAVFYTQDQGSELIPLAWLKALRQADGTAFLDGSLARYGYLPGPAAQPAGLPIGFTERASSEGTMVGMTCAACHVRQIEVGGVAYRIDGGPAIADFQAFVSDLDDAVGHTLTDATTFRPFAATVLGDHASTGQIAVLRAEFELWSVRFHTINRRALPQDHPWGPSRLDAIGMIFDRVAGLDVGVPPTYLIPDNIQRADAPARYPFLWNASRQDYTQWSGFAENGSDLLALSRNLGQLYGVFGTFHPRPVDASSAMIDHDYLSDNSANIAGLSGIETNLSRLGAPKWPGTVDAALAKRGAEIFDRPVENGGCVACHGEREGLPRPPNLHTLKTPVVDIGSDTRQWQVLSRRVATGSLAGATVPGVETPLHDTDFALQLLKTAIVGTLVQVQMAQAEAAMSGAAADNAPARHATMAAAAAAMPHAQLAGTMTLRMMPARTAKAAAPMRAVYEARVLNGIWAVAPYLHNGSVPTLADLLRPAAERPKRFEIGPVYDLKRVGLASVQPANAFTLHTTGCDDRASGDSVCGHEYGTRLTPEDKSALLEYLKTL